MSRRRGGRSGLGVWLLAQEVVVTTAVRTAVVVMPVVGMAVVAPMVGVVVVAAAARRCGW